VCRITAHRVPGGEITTLRRVLGDVDADALDAAVGAWLVELQPPAPRILICSLSNVVYRALLTEPARNHHGRCVT
jgi:hypothetical protein